MSTKRNREAEVLDAAIEVLYAHGYDAATIQDVADKVGVLKGSLYYYIDSKEDLLPRILTESYEQSQVILADAVALDASPLERLRRYFQAYVLWYLRNVERVSIYFNDWKSLTGVRRHTYNVTSAGAPMTSSMQPPALAWAWSLAVGDPSTEPRIVPILKAMP